MVQVLDPYQGFLARFFWVQSDKNSLRSICFRESGETGETGESGETGETGEAKINFWSRRDTQIIPKNEKCVLFPAYQRNFDHLNRIKIAKVTSERLKWGDLKWGDWGEVGRVRLSVNNFWCRRDIKMIPMKQICPLTKSFRIWFNFVIWITIAKVISFLLKLDTVCKITFFTGEIIEFWKMQSKVPIIPFNNRFFSSKSDKNCKSYISWKFCRHLKLLTFFKTLPNFTVHCI
jgi:hypothetical protein